MDAPHPRTYGWQNKKLYLTSYLKQNKSTHSLGVQGGVTEKKLGLNMIKNHCLTFSKNY